MAQAQTYNDTVVRQFAIMTVVWGVVGMAVGVLLAAQLLWGAARAPAVESQPALAGEGDMASLLLLIPLGLALLGASIWAFFWAVDHGQFDDLETPALRVLEDDAPPGEPVPAAQARRNPTHMRSNP